jgi:hypothetical protein
MCRAGGEGAYGRAMQYIRLSAATTPPATAATKSAIAPPCATPALARLVAQGAVSVASTRWAGEERRKGEGRTGAGTGACIRPVPSPCTHQQPPLDIPRRRLLQSTRARACARAQVTRWAPPRPMNHLLTMYHISTFTWPPLTCGPNYPSTVPISVHILSSSTHQSAATQEEAHQAAAAAATRPLPTPPHPTT